MRPEELDAETLLRTGGVHGRTGGGAPPPPGGVPTGVPSAPGSDPGNASPVTAGQEGGAEGGGRRDRWEDGGGGKNGRSRMTTDPRIPTMPGRSTSGFHRPGRRWRKGGGGELAPLGRKNRSVPGDKGEGPILRNRVEERAAVLQAGEVATTASNHQQFQEDRDFRQLR